jgi:hypothetical protein
MRRSKSAMLGDPNRGCTIGADDLEQAYARFSEWTFTLSEASFLHREGIEPPTR